MKLKSSLLVVGFVIVTFGLSQAQADTPVEKPATAELISKLQSKNFTERYSALEALRSDPAALRDPAVKTALVNLLDRENREAIAGEEEEYAEYTSWLADTVAKVVDWNDPHRFAFWQIASICQMNWLTMRECLFPASYEDIRTRQVSCGDR